MVHTVSSWQPLVSSSSTLRTFSDNANQESVRAAVSIALAGLMDEVLAKRPSSILFEFVCNINESYDAFMDAYKTGTVIQRLQD